MPADLTHDTTGPGAVTYGLTCMEHPSATRRGLTQAHATNAVAKHNRDHHEDGPSADLVNVSAACQVLLESWDDEGPGARLASIGAKSLAGLALMALTGLQDTEKAVDLARQWAEAQPPIVAHVAPF